MDIDVIPHSNLFNTCESLEALNEHIQKFSNHEKCLAYTISMMSFNVAYKMMKDQQNVKKNTLTGDTSL